MACKGGDTSAIIDTLDKSIDKAGKKPIAVANESDISNTCKSHKNGASNCYGAAIFHSSATEPVQGSIWNYTLRADTALGHSFNVESPNNDLQIYLLPFQQAIGQAITRRTPGYSGPDLSTVMQCSFTQKTEKNRENDTKKSYLDAGIAFFGVTFFFGMAGVVYHLTGVLAYEREPGLSALVEVMMPNLARWQPRTFLLWRIRNDLPAKLARYRYHSVIQSLCHR